jgi:hypothetical protein
MIHYRFTIVDFQEEYPPRRRVLYEVKKKSVGYKIYFH